MSENKRLSRRGLTAIEYALLASLISVGIMVALVLMSGNLSQLFTKTGSLIESQKAPVVGSGGSSSGGGGSGPGFGAN